MGLNDVSNDLALRAEINVTPLVDVVLVLLVVLMLMTPLLTDELPVELPTATHAEPQESAAVPTLTIAADGTMTFDGAPLAAERLGARLAGIYAGRADRALVLAADGALAYARVVAVLDACREANVERIGIATAPEARAE